MTGLLTSAVFTAIERIGEQALGAVWSPAEQGVKDRLRRAMHRDRKSLREAAFKRAVEIAHANTVRAADRRSETDRILNAVEGRLNKPAAEGFATEAVKVTFFSAGPDMAALTRICNERLPRESLWKGEPLPSSETVAQVLTTFLGNLREALLDQEEYHDLLQRESLRTLRQIVAELRPLAYSDEIAYRVHLARLCRELDFTGIPEVKAAAPITVDDIFVPLRAQAAGESRPPAPEARGERPAAFGLGHLAPGRAEATTRVELPSILKEPRVVILGDPGAGKTTLLKYIAVSCAEHRGTELGLDAGARPLPIFVPLREFAGRAAKANGYTLVDFINEFAQRHLLLNLPRNFFAMALERGRCVVCLDGLDEVWVPEHRIKVRDAVHALVQRFPGNRFIVTSRFVSYDVGPLDPEAYRHYRVLPLELDDIRAFVTKWYALRERDPVKRREQTADLLATLEREQRIRTLASNPLLLTIIALVHRVEAQLPYERVKLYEKCVTTLIETWEDVKGLSIEEKQRVFYRHRRWLLQRLAFEAHSRAALSLEQAAFREGDLELLISRFICGNPRLGFANDFDGSRDEARAFVRLVRGRTGLLVAGGEGTFSFAHPTFREYLAAADIETRSIYRGVDAIWEEIRPKLHDAHWREVVLLLLGSLGRYEEFPSVLVRRILESGIHDPFEPVLHRALILALRVLSDRIEVADTLHRSIIREAMKVVRIDGESARREVLAALPPRDRYVVREVESIVDDAGAEAAIRGDAAHLLGLLGLADKAVRVLHTIVIDPETTEIVRGDAIAALRHVASGGHDVTAICLDLLSRPLREGQLFDVVVTLGQCPPGHRGLGELRRVASSADVPLHVRREAARAMGQLGAREEAADVLERLVNATGDDTVRPSLARAVAEFAPAERAVRLLEGVARNGRLPLYSRILACDFLADVGAAEAGRSALDELRERANDFVAAAFSAETPAKTRRDIVRNLSRLLPLSRLADTLGLLARDPTTPPALRATALGLLTDLDVAEAARIFDDLLETPGLAETERNEILLQASRIPAAESVLARIVADTDSASRLTAARALNTGRQLADETVETLLRVIRESSAPEELRREALLAAAPWAPSEAIMQELVSIATGTNARSASAAYSLLKSIVPGGQPDVTSFGWWGRLSGWNLLLGLSSRL